MAICLPSAAIVDPVANLHVGAFTGIVPVVGPLMHVPALHGTSAGHAWHAAPAVPHVALDCATGRTHALPLQQPAQVAAVQGTLEPPPSGVDPEG